MMFKQIFRDRIAEVLAQLMKHFALDPRYFELWQAQGFHVKQVHFYSPFPDTRDLGDGLFAVPSELPGLEMNESGQLELLAEIVQQYRSEYGHLPHGKPDAPGKFFFGNVSFEAGDAEMLYGLIRKMRPMRVVEVGSGYSTLLAGQALAFNRAEGAEAELIAIEPYPRPFLREKLPYPVKLMDSKVQDIPVDVFTSLSANDILFIDSSHVCKSGSDVQFEFLEVFPRLAPGVLVHVHDIFLPFEYPKQWVREWHRFWNEQYLLQAFLSGNRDFEVVWAGAWMQHRHLHRIEKAFPSFKSGSQMGSFWIRRRPCQ